MDAMKRVAERIKKYLWIALVVPIVLGAVGWFLPIDHAFSRYQASATILLGSYGNSQLNDTGNVQIMLNNQPFYQTYLPKILTGTNNALPANLSVSVLKKTMIQIAYTSTSKQQAATSANQIADQFIQLDHKAYMQKEAILNQSVQRLKAVHDSAGVGAAAQMLYQLQSEQLNDFPAQILQPAEAGGVQGSTAFSSKKRAILGLVFGLALVFFSAAWPELVRNESTRKEKEKN